MNQEATSNSPGTGKNRQSFRDFVKNIENLGDEYLVEKAPFHIPTHLKEFIVKAAPYAVAILLLISLPAILAVIGLGSVIGVVNPYYGPLIVLSTAFAIATFALQIVSIKPLVDRKMIGWKYLFYAQILSFIAGVLGGSVFGAIIGSLVGFYILFQVKSYYE